MSRLALLALAALLAGAQQEPCRRGWQFDPAALELPLEPLHMYPLYHTCGSKNKDVYYWPQTCEKANGTMDAVMRSFRGKTVSFIGDSLTAQTFLFFLMSLELDGILYERTITTFVYDNNGTLYTREAVCVKGDYPRFNHCVLPDNSRVPCNCTELQSIAIPAYQATLLNLFVYDIQLPSNKPVHRNFLPMQLFADVVSRSDSAVVNAGLHFHDPRQLREVNRFILHVLASDLQTNPRKKHVYRHTFVSHFHPYLPWVTAYSRNKGCVPVAYPSVGNDIPEITAQFANAGIASLDYNHVLSTRGHLHPEWKEYLPEKTGEGLDCAHWCYSYELFYPFLQLLAKLV